MKYNSSSDLRRSMCHKKMGPDGGKVELVLFFLGEISPVQFFEAKIGIKNIGRKQNHWIYDGGVWKNAFI